MASHLRTSDPVSYRIGDRLVTLSKFVRSGWAGDLLESSGETPTHAGRLYVLAQYLVTGYRESAHA